jgi:hypothetical protein
VLENLRTKKDKRGKSNNLGKKKKYIEWRRDKTLELLAQGYSQMEIAKKLQVSEYTTSMDVSFLEEQSRQELRHHIEQRIPIECKKAFLTFESMKLRAHEILNKTEDNHVKLDAIKIINECTMRAVDIVTHHDVINNALSYVEFANKRLNSIEEREREKAKTDTEVKGIGAIIKERSKDNDTQGPREDNNGKADSGTDEEQPVF